MNNIQNNNTSSNLKFILIVVILALVVGGIIVFSSLGNKRKIVLSPMPAPSISPMPSVSPSISPAQTLTPSQEKQNNNISYATFSSAKADFTFEYPSAWVYEEEEIFNTIVWSFYSDSDKNENKMLEVHSPTYEVVDFCSVNHTYTNKNSYQLNVFPANDLKTYITYEQCGGEYGGGYIYWQKGKRFANADEIENIKKINLMLFLSGTENNVEIAKHIAQSIKIK